MIINHVALYVSDLERGKHFFETYFYGKSGEKYHNPKTGFMSYFISFEDGSRLEIMHDSLNLGHKGGEKRENQLGYAHIAFSVGSKDAVDRLTEQLRADGYPIISEPRTTGDGYYESCIADNEGNRIEITV